MVPGPAVLVDVVQQAHDVVAHVVGLRHEAGNPQPLYLAQLEPVELLVRRHPRLDAVVEGEDAPVPVVVATWHTVPHSSTTHILTYMSSRRLYFYNIKV